MFRRQKLRTTEEHQKVDDNMKYSPHYEYLAPKKYTSYVSTLPRKPFYHVDKEIYASPG